MKKIRYEIEATELGYTEKVFIDDELFSENEACLPDGVEYYEGRLTRKSGKSFSEILEEDGADEKHPDLVDLYDEFDNFMGISLVGHISNWAD